MFIKDCDTCQREYERIIEELRVLHEQQRIEKRWLMEKNEELRKLLEERKGKRNSAKA